MDVRPSGGQADDDFCLGAVDSANRAALGARKKKSRWGAYVKGAKISRGEAPFRLPTCQSSSLANLGPRRSLSLMERI